jgi:hypothetical protein
MDNSVKQKNYFLDEKGNGVIKELFVDLKDN